MLGLFMVILKKNRAKFKLNLIYNICVKMLITIISTILLKIKITVRHFKWKWIGLMFGAKMWSLEFYKNAIQKCIF